MQRLTYLKADLDDVITDHADADYDVDDDVRNEDLILVAGDAANLISSQTDHVGKHMPVIDIDIPNAVRIEPSSTEGHCHLYIDVPMSAKQYFKLLDAMASAGIVERGFAAAARGRGMSLVRKPGVKKVLTPIVDDEPF